jgi:hypothetical protein
MLGKPSGWTSPSSLSSPGTNSSSGKLEGDAESFGWQEGQSFPIDESYCKRVLDGRIPQVVPDAKGEEATRTLG